MMLSVVLQNGLAATPPHMSQPPQRLREISEHLVHPDVSESGLTTTENGDWALMVRLRSGVHAPVLEIERLSQGYPVVYRPPRERRLVARPAYPKLGE